MYNSRPTATENEPTNGCNGGTYTDSEGECESVGEAERGVEMNGTAAVEAMRELSPKWVFWVWDWDPSKEWLDCLRQQCTLVSVEDFIALKHYIVPPSRLPNNPGNIVNYMFFKESIKPLWDDPNNADGGGTIEFFIPRSQQHTHLDRFWNQLLMAAVGAQFGDRNKQICGVSLRFRKQTGFTISLWIRNAAEVKAYGPILEVLEAKLDIGANKNMAIHIAKHPEVKSGGQIRVRMNL